MNNYNNNLLAGSNRGNINVPSPPDELGYEVQDIRFGDLVNLQDDTKWKLFTKGHQLAYQNLRRLVDQALKNPELLDEPAMERFILNEWNNVNRNMRTYFGKDLVRGQRSFVSQLRK